MRWKKQTASIAPNARMTTLVYDSGRDIAIALGGHGRSDYADTWVWDGSAWAMALRYPSSKPPTMGGAACYVPGPEVIYELGGMPATPTHAVPTTAAWWLDMTGPGLWMSAPSDYPLARVGHAMAYDERRGLIVVFGGEHHRQAPTNETWEIDPWTGQWTAGGPAPDELYPRKGHAMAYDPGLQMIVMHAGKRDGRTVYGDTWLYNGQWVPGPSCAAPARAGHGLAWSGQALILHGGAAPGRRLGDIWTLSGNVWRQVLLDDSAAPPARVDHGMCTAPGGGIMIYGGSAGFGSWLGDTWVLR